MCDVASLNTADLRARLREAMVRRLEADTPAERDHAGEDLLAILDEMERRGIVMAHHDGGTDLRPRRSTASLIE
jgi:hypothetical protein